MLDVSVSVSASISAVEGVWGMLFQAFEYDIEFRLELQNFCKENQRVFLETFFA